MRFNVPNQLRQKYVSSEVSREIFFIDCFNDLYNCAKSDDSYNFIRSSISLRMLLLDKGLETISKKYNFNIELCATQYEIAGVQLSGKQTRDIIDIFSIICEDGKTTEFLKLCDEPLRTYTLEEFNKKVCLKVKGSNENSFSQKNIINIISNKHGAAHLDAAFDSSTYESFFLGRFSPYSLKDGNFFLEKIKEILIIIVIALVPLCKKIIGNLEKYNSENIQQESISYAMMLTYEEYEKRKK
jgi:hypothetical protein